MMKRKPLDYVILDTDIILKENFLQGKRLRQLFKMGEYGQIKLALTEITIEEVKNNFKKQIELAKQHHSQFKNKGESKAFRNVEIGDNLFPKPKIDELTKEFNEKFEKALVDSSVEIIPYTSIDIEPIFKNYFEGNYPFGNKNKKSEFPDAFALALIDEWSKKYSQKCFVFSLDKDFLNSKMNSLVTIGADYEKYLNDKLEIILNSRLKTLDKVFSENDFDINNHVEKHVKEQLDDFSFYDFIYHEIQDINNPEVIVKEKEFTLVAIHNEEEIEIEIIAKFDFSVEVTIDDENSSIYDSEDKVVYYMDTIDKKIEGEGEAVIAAMTMIVSEFDYQGEFDILEISDNLHIDLGDEYW